VIYLVINLTTGERGGFTRARDVALYMWGRDFTKYTIWRNGSLFVWTEGNLAAFEQALEAL
jgi:hypothetical protein